MFLSLLKSIFDIDNVGKRWGVRILYLVTVVLNAAIYFNPFADTDFTPLQNWIMTFYNMNEYDPEVYDALFMTFPLSKGNMIYLATLILGDLILLTSTYIYTAMFIRNFRLEKIQSIKENDPEAYDYAVQRMPDKPIEIKKLIGRLFILVLVSVIIAIPVLSISLYFMFLAVLGLPFIFAAPAAYLSGDAGLFMSLPYSVRLARKYYFINMRSIAVIILTALVLDFLLPLLANVSMTAFYILDSALTAWICLSFGRLMGLAYCTMKDFPIKGGRRPLAI